MYTFTALCHSDAARISYPYMIFQVVYIARFIRNGNPIISMSFIIFHAFFRLYYTSMNAGGVLPYDLAL